MATPLRVAFAGTPAFAATALAAICRAGLFVPLVLTQPDRPAGRGLRLQPSPVKQFASQHGLSLIQPQGLKLDGRFAGDARAARVALLTDPGSALVNAIFACFRSETRWQPCNYCCIRK